MRVNGLWLQSSDGAVRPVIRAEILGGDAVWREIELLVDTGADRTVISADVLDTSNFLPIATDDRIAGVGGIIDAVLVNTRFRFIRDDGGQAFFRGQFAACTQPEALDMSVLGRDILDMFSLIVDHRSDVVAILGGRHRYSIHQDPQ